MRSWREWLVARRCDAAGPLLLDGLPYIDNRGEIRLGARVAIASAPVRTHIATARDGRIVLGDDVAVGHGVAMCAHREIVVGARTQIGPFSILIDTDFHGVRTRCTPDSARPIRIGRGVRIGAGTIILRGASIGDGAVIGPGSVVARWIPPGVRAGGVPAIPLSTPRACTRAH